jgi:hypothetical protein
MATQEARNHAKPHILHKSVQIIGLMEVPSFLTDDRVSPPHRAVQGLVSDASYGMSWTAREARKASRQLAM